MSEFLRSLGITCSDRLSRKLEVSVVTRRKKILEQINAQIKKYLDKAPVCSVRTLSLTHPRVKLTDLVLHWAASSRCTDLPFEFECTGSADFDDRKNRRPLPPASLVDSSSCLQVVLERQSYQGRRVFEKSSGK